MAYSHLWDDRRALIEPQRHDFDAARGLVYSVALSLVFVWLPILYVVSRYGF
jgi:hypothetical protein